MYNSPATLEKEQIRPSVSVGIRGPYASKYHPSQHSAAQVNAASCQEMSMDGSGSEATVCPHPRRGHGERRNGYSYSRRGNHRGESHLGSTARWDDPLEHRHKTNRQRSISGDENADCAAGKHESDRKSPTGQAPEIQGINQDNVAPVQLRDPRTRTFPIPLSTCNVSNYSHIGDAAISVLNFLYSGNKKYPTNMTTRSSATRAQIAVAQAVDNLHEDVGAPKLEQLGEKSGSYTSTTRTEIPLREICTGLFCSERDNLADRLKRGDFQLLEAGRLDLPATVSRNADVWVTRLTHGTRSNFENPSLTYLLDPVKRALSDKPKFPTARVHAKKKQYPKVLEKADNAKMIEWSIVKDESPQHRSLAANLKMTSFAVAKSETRDRLISWPRVQNDLMPVPPYKELPNPSLYSNLRLTTTSSAGGFYFDVSNIFHNIRLPTAMVKYFPLMPVAFGHLPAQLQQRLILKFKRPLSKSDVLRPCQATLPMGFKWAVFIAHTFARSCIEEATLKIYLSDVCRSLQVQPIMKTMSRANGIMKIENGDILLLHILDDVNFIAFGLSDESVLALQASVENVFASTN